MTLVPINSWNISVIIVGYLISLLGGRYIVGTIVRNLWIKYMPPPIQQQRNDELVGIFGFVENFLYTTAILINVKEFIAVWLALKIVGQWTQTKTDTDRPLYYLFMIGNGLSLILSVGVGLIILQLLHS